MKCFTHQQVDALGVCRSCLKGVCVDCAIDIGDGIACRDSCEEKAKEIVNVLQTSIGAQKDFKKRGVYLFPLFCVSLGLVFMVSSYYARGWINFLSVSGAIFALFGIAMLWLNRRHAKRIN